MNHNHLNNQPNNQEEDRIDLVDLLNKVLDKWFIFLICALIGVTVSYFYSKIFQNKYQVETTILIQNENQASNVKNIFETNSYINNNIKITNQIGILGSFTLCKQALENLNWKVFYFRSKFLSHTDLYQSSPFQVILKESAINLPNVPIYIDPLSDSTYLLSVNYDASFQGNDYHLEYEEIVEFGKLYENNFFSFIVTKYPDFKFNKEFEYYFVISDFMSLAKSYQNKMEISWITEESDLIKVKLTGSQPERDVDFLNELSKVYIESDLDKKNRKSDNTVKFIDSQLSGVIDSLQTANNNFTDFRSRNQIVDLSQEGNIIVERLKELEAERAKTNLKYEYYKNLVKYIDNSDEMEQVVAPSVVGITDPVLNTTVTRLSDLYTRLRILSMSVTDRNPALISIKQEIDYTKQLLEENLKSLTNNALFELENFQTRERDLRRQLVKLPQTEQDLVNIKRDFDINNELYTFLLQKRAESAIVKASNLPDAHILDIARVETAIPIGPSSKIFLVLGFFVGLIIPLFVFIILEYLHFRLSTRQDVEKNTSLNVIGDIIHNKEKAEIPVIKYPKSPISESFRKLRTNLKYLLSDSDKKVVAIHSAVKEEGKTFVSVNLAIITAMAEKKVLLIDGDLRKPKLHKIFNLSNATGLSNYLINRLEFDKLIVQTDIKNLSIVLSGPIPPNPAELIESHQFERFIQIAKEKYDFIIIDNAPSLLVTDGALISKIADFNLFVIRLNKTYIVHLKAINSMSSNGIASKVGLVVNDIRSNKFGAYNAYGSKYY